MCAFITVRWHCMIIWNLYSFFFLIYFSTGLSSSTQTFKYYQTGAAGLSWVAEGELIAVCGCFTMMNYYLIFLRLTYMYRQPIRLYWKLQLQNAEQHFDFKTTLIHLIKVPVTWKIIASYLTAYKKKNSNDIFLFGISFFVLEILPFSYYEN